MEEFRVGAVSQGVEWLRSALSEISRDELRALAAAGGVETRPNNKWLTVPELRSALMEVLAPPTEVGCVKKLVLTKVVFPESACEGFFVKKHAAVVIHLHTLTSADLHLRTFTPADLHLHTLTSADLHLRTLTSADLHLHTFTSADLHLHTLTSADLHLHTLTSADLHTFTSADLHLHTLTSADLHLHTFTSADLHLHTLTSADLHLHTFTSSLALLSFSLLRRGRCRRSATKRNPFARNGRWTSKTAVKLRFSLVEMDVGRQKLK